MSEPPESPDRKPETLAAGDALARRGDWLAALDAWDVAVRRDASLRPSLEGRLAWFLDETAHRPRPLRSRAFTLVGVSAAAALLATAFVAVAGTPGSTSANLWAIAAWAMIVVSAVAAVVAAKPPEPERVERLIERSRRVAANLHADSNRNGRTA